MPVIKAEYCLCLNGKVVAVEKESLPWMDPFGLAPDDLDDDKPLPVSIVDVKVMGDRGWLTSAMDIKVKWWQAHHHKVPLFSEILQLIKSKKIFKGAGARTPKQHKSLLPLKIRNKTMWFANNSRVVSLALVQGQEIEQLEWFMHELYQDIEDLMAEDEAEAEADAPVEKHKIDKNLQTIVDQTLSTLQDHHGCQSVHYLASRNSLKVVRKGDKATKEHRLKSLKRKLQESQEHDNEELLQNLFDIAVAECINFLDYQDKEPAGPAADVKEPAADDEGSPSAPVVASSSSSSGAPGAIQD